MALFGLFATKDNTFQDLHQTLSSHLETAKTDLYAKHPHVENILTKHNVDLSNVRKHKNKIAAGAAIGALLAFPHLLDNPNDQLSQPTEILSHSQTIGEVTTSDETANHTAASTNPAKPEDTHLNQTTSSNPGQTPANNPPVPPPNPEQPGDDNPSQGHQYGRSYLAPPKDHDLHDLGLHQGEDKGQGKAEAPGPHPEELDVVHKGDKG